MGQQGGGKRKIYLKTLRHWCSCNWKPNKRFLKCHKELEHQLYRSYFSRSSGPKQTSKTSWNQCIWQGMLAWHLEPISPLTPEPCRTGPNQESFWPLGAKKDEKTTYPWIKEVWGQPWGAFTNWAGVFLLPHKLATSQYSNPFEILTWELVPIKVFQK